MTIAFWRRFDELESKVVGWESGIGLDRRSKLESVWESVEVYESTLHHVNKALCLCKKLIEFLVRPMFNYTST